MLSWSSPGLTHILVPTDNETTPEIMDIVPNKSPGFTVTNNEGALIGSMVTVGALIAAIPIGYISDKVGRKFTLILLALLFLINWILLCFSSNLEMVVAARFFAGMGLGGICVVAPMYIGEIAEPAYRGTFGSFFQLFLSSGILFTCVVGYVTNWLGLAIVLGVTPIVFGGSMCFMPESPIYSVAKNKLSTAERNLKRLRGSSSNISTELKMIQKDIADSQKRTASFMDIFSRGNLRAVIAVFGVLAFQQLSGINAIVFYTVNIFKAAGTDLSPFLSAIIVNSIQVVVSYFSILVIEKANRRFYLIFSSTGMMLCLVSIGVFFHFKVLHIDTSRLAWIPLGSAIIYMACFSVGYGPVPWMLLGEMFSSEIKGIASGIAILVNWSLAFVVTMFFPIMNAALGEHITFYIFSCILGLGSVFVYFLVPETRGKTLAQIQEELNL